ncbi:hypothetical protein ACHAP5_010475 [Fusarium lateritium]
MVERDEKNAKDLIGSADSTTANCIKTVGEVSDFIGVYMDQLGRDLGTARARVELIVQEINKTPLSEHCWRFPQHASFWERIGVSWFTLSGSCQSHLVRQVTEPKNAFEEEHTNRVRIKSLQLEIACPQPQRRLLPERPDIPGRAGFTPPTDGPAGRVPRGAGPAKPDNEL